MDIPEYKFENTDECPSCGRMSMRCIDSRLEETGVRRRRKVCTVCGFRHNTYEMTEVDLQELTSGYGGHKAINERNILKNKLTILKGVLKDVETIIGR